MSENPAQAVADRIRDLIADLERRITEAEGPVPHLHAQLREQNTALQHVIKRGAK